MSDGKLFYLKVSGLHTTLQTLILPQGKEKGGSLLTVEYSALTDLVSTSEHSLF